MTLLERITEETRELPVHTQQQVLDFIHFLKQQENRQFIAEVDALIVKNLPALHAMTR